MSESSSTVANESPAKPAPVRWAKRLLGWTWKAVSSLLLIGLILWGTLALYYQGPSWMPLRIVLAAAFAALGIWALWRAKSRRAVLLFVAAYIVLLGWWSTIKSSHERPWRREVAVMPRTTIDGDHVHITGYRNFDFRTRHDFTERYEERDYDLSHLTGMDFYISYWTLGPVGHTFLSFLFDNAPPLCISIETRPEVGEGFAPVASMFKTLELIYVVGDERDLVHLRTNHRDEEVFLFHLLVPAEDARRLLLVYLDRINELADRPEWYHLLKNNCAINIVRYANAAGREGRFHIGHLLNGWFDVYLYEGGWLDTSFPLEELRRRSHINASARTAEPDENFFRHIRSPLPIPKY